MSLFGLREPQKKAPEAEIVCDLDSIVEKRAAVVLGGVTHFIRPVTTQNFVVWVTKLAKLKQLSDPGDIRDLYFEMTSDMIPSITKEVVNGMTQHQCVALFAAICEKVMGKTPETEEKKNP